MMLLCKGLDSSATGTYEHLNDGQLDVLRVMQSVSPGKGLSEHIKGYAPHHVVNMPDENINAERLTLTCEHTQIIDELVC